MATRVTKEQEVIKRAREEIEKKTGKTPEQLYEEREKRITDAVALKEPDRVPVTLRLAYFPLKYVGLPFSAVYYDPDAYTRASIKTVVDFEPDAFSTPRTNAASGFALQSLDSKNVMWPGGKLSPDLNLQIIDMAPMQENEYDLFIADPTDFMLRCYLPRVLGTLEPMAKLPSLGLSLSGGIPGFVHFTRLFTTPEFQRMSQAVFKAGQEEEKFEVAWRGFHYAMTSLGVPPDRYPGPGLGEPYDVFASYLRGLQGITTDIFRQPEKLIAACEKVLEWWRVRAVPADPKQKWYPRRVQCGAFHFSSDRFLSKKQFATFSWPTWKKSLLAAIDLGYIPSPFGEGTITDRLEFLHELPKGKFYVKFADVDIARAKAILGGYCCLDANVPSSLLEVGSPQEVEEYCKNLIKIGGKGGGFMLGCHSGNDEAKPENIRAMIDAVKKYGRY